MQGYTSVTDPHKTHRQAAYYEPLDYFILLAAFILFIHGILKAAVSSLSNKVSNDSQPFPDMQLVY
jgi:ABC-type arginine/histidine transport system permease subunit